MSCEKAREEHEEAVEAHTAAEERLKRYEAAIFGGTSPRPIFLSDQDVENLERLEAEEQAAARVEKEKADTYEEAKGAHK